MQLDKHVNTGICDLKAYTHQQLLEPLLCLSSRWTLMWELMSLHNYGKTNQLISVRGQDYNSSAPPPHQDHHPFRRAVPTRKWCQQDQTRDDLLLVLVNYRVKYITLNPCNSMNQLKNKQLLSIFGLCFCNSVTTERQMIKIMIFLLHPSHRQNRMKCKVHYSPMP